MSLEYYTTYASPPPSILEPDEDFAPPEYTPSSDSPVYSAEPGPSEERLALTSRRSARRPPPTTALTRSNSAISVALLGQEAGASAPIYGSQATICGDIGLKDAHAIQEVRVKVKGTLELTGSDNTGYNTTFFEDIHTLWTADDTSSPSASCPTIVPFEITLPATCRDNNTRPLPPSFDLKQSGFPSLHVDCSYTITVSTTQTRSLKQWRTHKKLTVPFIYKPRTRPHQPILPSSLPFLPSIKSLPEEWHQTTSTMGTYLRATIEPIDSLFFIPSAQIYSLSDTIPFYVQLQAPSESLHHFLQPSSSSSLSSKLTRRSSHQSTDPHTQPIVRVILQRHVIGIIDSVRITRTFTIGEATIRVLPSDTSSRANVLRRPDDGKETLDYQGEIKCIDSMTVGGFTAERLVVKDFIMLQLVPANHVKSDLKEHQVLVPIRLVTDPFAEPSTRELDDSIIS
ncbi:uncharacterized protein STEHIDRAFT_80011 [Stereum hirsutum FP-91666 SS1]|uniref:uncharacterized protein n=1 Tax=Stereum hirsutum (strain FP-91666) TaxID=721885 RepID=UPI000444A5D7|nr:uncharacterized protein STEHIDRAFT_80011 [Stereum hirsutum FP-91666 SS1]EIM85915.1 hypothetical protein STEHIDRAFT_80011 [Stereum hirsutum FP-91666 SS1]